MKKVTILITLISIIFTLTACASTKSNIIGKWESDNGYMYNGHNLKFLEFFSNNTYTSNSPNYQGVYSIDSDRINLQGILEASLNFTFDIQNNKLNFYNEKGELCVEYKKSK